MHIKVNMHNKLYRRTALRKPFHCKTPENETGKLWKTYLVIYHSNLLLQFAHFKTKLLGTACSRIQVEKVQHNLILMRLLIIFVFILIPIAVPETKRVWEYISDVQKKKMSGTQIIRIINNRHLVLSVDLLVLQDIDLFYVD